MIKLKVLKMIIMLCAVNSLEDTHGKWTELHNIEKYQRDCRVWYIDCYDNSSGSVDSRLTKCIKKRQPKK